MTHTPAPLVFLDTETTGLERDADIWEFAAIRREPDGTETQLHLFIEHDWEKCARLPAAFRDDHLARFPGHDQHTSRLSAANQIYRFLTGDDGHLPHVVGAVPNFDTERISLLLRTQLVASMNDPWHYHLIDVENLAIGYLAGEHASYPGTTSPAPSPPWTSDELSLFVGIDPDATGPRHTALADARWAMAIYDRVMKG